MPIDIKHFDGMMNEIDILRRVKHRNLIRMSDCFRTSIDIWLVTDLMDFATLHDIIGLMKVGGDEPIIATIMYEVLKGLHYLHSHELVHRDIRSTNILLNGKKGTIKIADFGNACFRKNVTKEYVGAPWSLAPEVITNYSYDYASDIWALGMTAIEMTDGEPLKAFPRIEFRSNETPRLGISYKMFKKIKSNSSETVTIDKSYNVDPSDIVKSSSIAGPSGMASSSNNIIKSCNTSTTSIANSIDNIETNQEIMELISDVNKMSFDDSSSDPNQTKCKTIMVKDDDANN
ncbi:hypothetical protein RDWZM_010402 [Blomia tropicalis]|uniref:non-specific serine/threonine protein kinase n=1 Tax=Blomia tropicalis TaxID=40697 RepID=A0A9Q0LZ47_BLOTA|nr:hypothetical protein RDWZM_010402 [Blomia tropicalis]